MSTYKLQGKVEFNIETTLEGADDYMPSDTTLQFLVEQDLLDLGYDIDNFKVVEFDISEIK